MHLNNVIDPDHRAVRRRWRAALAAGADGLMVDIHPRPGLALCDGEQALSLEDFGSLMRSLAAPRVEAPQGR